MESFKELVSGAFFHSWQRTIMVLGGIVLAISLPVTILLSQQEQDIRQSAAPQSCSDSPADIMLITDVSISMNADGKFSAAKSAAKSFVNKASENSQNAIGLVSFGDDADLESSLSNNFKSVISEINDLDLEGATCIACAIKRANDEISSKKRNQYKNVIILLTDGVANRSIKSGYDGKNSGVQDAEKNAIEQAKAGFSKNNTVIFTIGLGNEINSTFLKKIAAETGGKYYSSPSSSQLNTIYQEIATITGKGIISGFVYNDSNQNNTYEDSEQKLSGWQVKIIQNNSIIETKTTDENGSYSFVGLCNGEFKAELVRKNDWSSTSPANGTHNISISQGSAENEANFGVSNVISPTSIDISVRMPGIGSNTPTEGQGTLNNNEDPIRKTREVEIMLGNSAGENVTSLATGNQESIKGTLTFDLPTFSYKGTVSVGNLPTGNYQLFVRLDNTLYKSATGYPTITKGQTNTIPPLILVSGDIDTSENSDNDLNLNDYISFISCYKNADTCTSEQKQRADLDDNGTIDTVDITIMQRGFAIRSGDSPL